MDNHALNNESIILDRVAHGDTSAFRVLYDTHRTRIYSFAYSLTHSESQAQEITQEVFIKVWEHREQLSNMEFFSAWIGTITRNTTYGFFRRQATELKVLADLSARSPVVEYPHVQLEQKELYNRLWEAISTLSHQQRLIYQLSREEGRTYAEIAAELGISTHTVKYHLSAIYNRLREKLGPMILFLVLYQNI